MSETCRDCGAGERHRAEALGGALFTITFECGSVTTNDNPPGMDSENRSLACWEYQTAQLKTKCARLERGSERRRAKLVELCHHYCQWYEDGFPNQSGQAEAYDLVTIAREALKL